MILFEVRGTRSSLQDKSAEDGVVHEFANDVSDRLKGQVLPVPVDYGAIPMPSIISVQDFISHAYVDSEKDGIGNLKRAIQHYEALYPDAWIGFVGYSPAPR